MSFTYINPGNVNLLDIQNGTTVENSKYNPYSGVSFWQSDSDGGIKLSEIPTEIYAKMTVAIRSDVSESANTRMFVGNSNGWTIRESYGAWYLDITCGNSQIKSLKGAESNLNFNGLNDILLHAKAGYYEEGLISITVNGHEVFTANRTVKFVKDSSYATESDFVILYCKNEKTLMSNIIISDSAVECKEQVAVLPVTEMDSDMSANDDGSYSATAAGQHLFQKVDAASLISMYGGLSKVTGLYIIGNPAYRTGSEITEAIACTRRDGMVEEIGKAKLSMENTAKALIGGKVSMTLDEMNGYEFGWKAGV